MLFLPRALFRDTLYSFCLLLCLTINKKKDLHSIGSDKLSRELSMKVFQHFENCRKTFMFTDDLSVTKNLQASLSRKYVSHAFCKENSRSLFVLM